MIVPSHLHPRPERRGFTRCRVNGIAVYSGGQMKLIRVDQFFSSDDSADAMLADLMADVRAFKQSGQARQ